MSAEECGAAIDDDRKIGWNVVMDCQVLKDARRQGLSPTHLHRPQLKVFRAAIPIYDGQLRP
jgi:hypothetical protein